MCRKAFVFSCEQMSRKGGRLNCRAVPPCASHKLFISCDPYLLRHNSEGNVNSPLCTAAKNQDLCNILESQAGSPAVALFNYEDNSAGSHSNYCDANVLLSLEGNLEMVSNIY